jgi:hypothetical protein
LDVTFSPYSKKIVQGKSYIIKLYKIHGHIHMCWLVDLIHMSKEFNVFYFYFYFLNILVSGWCSIQRLSIFFII